MAVKRSSADQFLQKVGGTFYARVRVPRTLEKYVGQSHIRRSLQTGDKTEANRRKFAMVARIKAELEAIRKSAHKDDAPGLSFAAAKAIRDQLKELKQAGDHDMAQTVEGVTVEQALRVEALYGEVKANKWFRAATVTSESLKELLEKWLGVSDYKESTKAGHRKALTEVLAFLEDEDAVPDDVPRRVALQYIDDNLTQRNPPLAHTTIRDRLVSLGGFWGWMESRGAVQPNTNPWTGHKISKKQNASTRPPKRTFTDAEILRLLKGTDKAKTWPTYAYMPDLMILGLFTGARIEELCSRDIADVIMAEDHAFISIKDSKTKAGIRFVAVCHPAPLAVLRRRLDAEGPALFPELSAGGLDDKLSASVVKAFGRYRRECDVPDGTDFHSFRRNVITVLEAAGVGQVPIARFVGHNVGTMAGDTYSAGGSKANALATARQLDHGKLIDAASLALSQGKA